MSLLHRDAAAAAGQRRSARDAQRSVAVSQSQMVPGHERRQPRPTRFKVRKHACEAPAVHLVEFRP